MRIAYLAVEIPEREAVSPILLDAEEILGLSRQHTVDVFVDFESAGVERLREAGVAVIIAPKRFIQEGPTLRSSDAMIAGQISEKHATEPYDEIWFDAGHPTDPSFFEPILAELPTVAVLPGTFASVLPLVWSVPRAIASHGIRSWAQAGRLAAADRLIADAPPPAYGLLPAGLASVDVMHPQPEPSAVPAEVGLVVVVATALDAHGYATLLTRVAERVDAATVAIVHSDRTIGGIDIAELVEFDPPVDQRQATILVPTGTDGTASRFLASADAIICATAADLAVPAVRDACRNRPWLLLDESTVAEAPRTDDADPVTVDLIEVSPGSWPELIRSQAVQEMEAAMTIFHTPDRYLEAIDLAGYARLASNDLAFVVNAEGIFGEPMTEIDTGVMGIHRRAAGAVLRAAGGRASLDEAIPDLFDTAFAGHASIAFYPFVGHNGMHLSWTAPGAAGPWIGGRPVLSYSAVNISTVRTSPSVPVESSIDVRQWVAGRGWADRARLALPWRWNLLERGMRDRW